MKVLFIHCFYQYKGGEDTVVYEEIKLLKNNGIITDLLAFNNEKNSLLNVIQMPFNISAYKKTLLRIKEFKPDIIHMHNLHFAASPSVVYAIKKSKVPFVITLHNYRLICPSALLFYNGKSFLNSIHQKFYWRAIRHRVYRNSYILTFWLSVTIKLHQLKGTWKNCKKFIVLNQYSKEIFEHSSINAGENKFTVKPNFCASPKMHSQERSNDFLYIGRLSEEKGINLLLNAFAANGFNLIIAGDGPYKEKVINYSKRFNNIKFLGLVDKEKVFSLMQSCTALVFPSIWPEGMPLTIIEALACGMPVITSKSGAMLDMITDEFDGLYFETGNEEDLKVKTIKWQKFSDHKKSRLRKNALITYNKKYTQEANFTQLINIYNNATGITRTKPFHLNATVVPV